MLRTVTGMYAQKSWAWQAPMPHISVFSFLGYWCLCHSACHVSSSSLIAGGRAGDCEQLRQNRLHTTSPALRIQMLFNFFSGIPPDSCFYWLLSLWTRHQNGNSMRAETLSVLLTDVSLVSKTVTDTQQVLNMSDWLTDYRFIRSSLTVVLLLFSIPVNSCQFFLPLPKHA